MAKRIDIAGRIVSDDMARIYSWYGMNVTSPSKIYKALDEANGEDVELYINSPGGSVYDASDIYTNLREYKGNITAKIVGVAASAASWIAMAANKVVMSPTGLMMIHNTQTYSEGDYRDMDDTSSMLSQADTAVRNAYKIKTGLSDEEIKKIMDEDTWFNCTKAKEYNLVDEIMFDSEDILSPQNILNGLSVEPSTLVNIFNSKGGVEVEKEKLNISENSTETEIVIEAVPVVDNKPAAAEQTITSEVIKTSYREIYDEIFNAGVMAERTRLKDIEDLGVGGFDDIVNRAKFTEPVNAESLAMAILKAQNQIGAVSLQNLISDKENIVVDNTAIDVTKEADKKEDMANLIAGFANERRK